MIDPYQDDDDELPTLQRVAPTSSNMAAASAHFNAFPDEATTATDLDVLGPLSPLSPIADARSFEDIDTEKMPVEVAAGLVRASQIEDGA